MVIHYLTGFDICQSMNKKSLLHFDFFGIFMGAFLAVVFSVVLLGCGNSEPVFREYTEITSGGKGFGQQGGVGIQGTGQVTSQEVELFNRVTYDANLSDGITWSTPSGWKEIKETGVRLVSFQTANGLEVTLIAFPGNVGGIGANLSRWVGQVDAQLSDTAMNSVIQSLNATGNKNGLPYILVDFDNIPEIVEQNKPKSILAAIFGFNDQMLFVKVIGDKASMVGDREAFQYLVDSINVGKKS